MLYIFNPCKFILEIMLALGDGENKILVLRQEAGLREIFQLHSYLQVKFSKIEVYVEINTLIGFVMDYLK